MSSQEWRNYCLWRKREFTSFDSLDSTIHNSMFSVEEDDDWNYSVSNGHYLTDVANDFAYAQRYAQRCGADEILIFDFVDNEDATLHVVGYDILDGAFNYSLLTNFGNDITIVNDCLGPNGLIRDKDKALEVHRWFMNNMPDDHHVIGSRLFTVYDKFVQQDVPSNRSLPPSACASSEEPGAVIPHFLICDGVTGQPVSLPQSADKTVTEYLQYFRPGEEARMIARCQFGIRRDGSCSAIMTYPIKGSPWSTRRNPIRMYEFHIRPELATELFTEVRNLQAESPDDCLPNDSLWSDHTEPGSNAVTRDSGNVTCHTIYISTATGYEVYYSMREDSAALQQSELYRTITNLVSPYETLQTQTKAAQADPPNA